ncbi:TIGR03086 family metal-binding protein [Glycomyces tritici]|uniref:TIGR03086 family metal-binding protein n=1 Tax=Glycomyces tritici TaxID=2665176 RepID=A0ABT7YLR0_9ACTN|nr:TIGR03086 family metal-binding protein [Glycomyces tritici]MDN3239520.1 TIGR03086 family metal-binding protein [Glycomyces tritici]
MIDFKTVTDQVASLVDQVRDEGLGDATPCGHYTQAQLLNHLTGLSLAFTAAARGETGPHNDAPPGEPPTSLEPGWRDELKQRLGELADAWSEPSAWEGEALAGGVTLPASVMGLVALNEVAVHGWDLAAATGRPYALDPDVIETLTAFTGQDADDQSAREGVYAPVVELPAGASPQDRLIALTGRDPAWRP